MSFRRSYGHLSIGLWHSTEACSRCSSSEASPSHARVDLNILFKHDRQHIYCLPDGSTQFLGGGHVSRQQISCSFDLCSFLSESKTSHATLLEKLSSLGIKREGVGDLVAYIFSEGWEILMTNRLYMTGQSVIFLKAMIRQEEHVWLHYERYLTHRVMRESMQEFESRNFGMVPASESSLGLLRGIRVAETRLVNCSICLEEVEVGSEATSMPCSHVFHGDCIVKWLKLSHCCPVCRYEMPTL